MICFNTPNSNPSSPAQKRLTSIKTALEEHGLQTAWDTEDKAKSAGIRYVSFPPFPRLTDLIKLLFCRRPLIIEYRDGWSLAILTGYGSVSKPKILKGWITRLVEIILRLVSVKLVTVTPGLVRWHGPSTTLFLPNGSEITKPSPKKRVDLNKSELQIVCFGKFASYGTKNINKALGTLNNRYSGKKITIHIYSNSPQETEVDNHYHNISLIRMDPIAVDELDLFLRKYDIGIAIIRDPKYDFGTKVFDYAQAGLPILNYFDKDCELLSFFEGSFDTDQPPEILRDYSRSAMLREADFNLLVQTINENT